MEILQYFESIYIKDILLSHTIANIFNKARLNDWKMWGESRIIALPSEDPDSISKTRYTLHNEYSNKLNKHQTTPDSSPHQLTPYLRQVTRGRLIHWRHREYLRTVAGSHRRRPYFTVLNISPECIFVVPSESRSPAVQSHRGDSETLVRACCARGLRPYAGGRHTTAGSW